MTTTGAKRKKSSSDRATAGGNTARQHKSVSQTKGGSKPSLYAITVPLAVGILTFAAFSGSLGHEFVNWDDAGNFTLNQNYRGLGLDNLRWMFTTFHLGPYQPLSWLSLAVETLIWNDIAFAHHFGNLVYHALTTIVVYFVAARLLSKAAGVARDSIGCRLAAAFAALLFGVHPLRVESVAWATERRDVLSGLLTALTVLLYLRAVEKIGTARRMGMLAAIVVYALSLLAKATGMTLPFVLLLMDMWPLRRFGRSMPEAPSLDERPRTVLLEKTPYLLLAVMAGVLAVYGQLDTKALQSLEYLGVIERVTVASYGACYYVWKTIVPGALYPMYSMPPIEELQQWSYRGFILIVIAVTLAAIGQWRRRPWMATLWFSYLALTAPVSGLVQAGEQIAADRYSYLPGMVLGLAGAGLVLAARRRIETGVGSVNVWNAAVAGSIAIVALLASRTAGQTQIWRNSETLWRHVLTFDPLNTFAHSGLGNALMDRNDYEGAISHFEAAAAKRSDMINLVNLSTAYQAVGRLEEAIEVARKAVAVSESHPIPALNLGRILMEKGYVDEAVVNLRKAVELRPDSAEAHWLLSGALIGLGQTDEAEPHILESLRLDPSSAHRHLHASQFFAGKWRLLEAAETLKRGLTLNPQHRGLIRRLAWMQATSPDPNVRNGAEALERALWLCEQTAYDEPRAVATLAMALAEVGRYDEAINAIDRALQVCPPDFPASERSQYEKAREAFVTLKPYRDIGGTNP
jgi:tetratricopeptide (TPR) repeat protein